MFDSCIEKQNYLKTLFSACRTDEERYQKIIELGKELPLLDPQYKNENNIVQGCQSIMYLHSFVKEGLIYFVGESNALISAGLAAILIHVYSGEKAETVMLCPPDFLDQLQIGAGLSPSRANGLYSIHLRMKQDALKVLSAKKLY